MAYTDTEIQNSFLVCKEITQKASTTFYLGSQFFPRELRKYIWVIYAFCRTSDDIVDATAVSESDRRAELHIRDKMIDFIFGSDSLDHRFSEIYPDIFLSILDESIVCAMVQLRRHNQYIQKKPYVEVLSGMKMDLNTYSYRTYDELSQFSYKVAGTVGEMICNLCGIVDSSSIGYAHVLGESMQLTNVLRDIGEDLDRGRIYIPANDLQRYDVDLPTLAMRARVGNWGSPRGDAEMESRFKEMMRFLVSINCDLYSNAQTGIHSLPLRIRKPVQIASMLYQGILIQIQKNNFNVFTKRAFVPMRYKIRTVLLSQF
jgi:15-cis-phytoene synthase